MKTEERYYGTKWRYDNHFKDDETKETLINDAGAYINELEEVVYRLKDTIECYKEGQL
ncbi:TPA: hypothetical protein R1940_001333 [Staphylococcus delphini]|nr:hypothetical protein [Staphylococcus delphini]HEC2167411.1 hypothetical protein [Staphylococcus delphini]HEC2190261.1 hypothetical protein [Staphylococcus delphini]HEC2222284.1 hypothetical protein [Staphylococcus delphini]HEC2229104.1 hypothetical protein [Staphylococcus delphini]